MFMYASNHNIVCVQLTEHLFEDLVLNNDNASYNVHLVSPLGNIFLVGNVEDIAEIHIDEDHVEYLVNDAGDAERRILFTDGRSDYSILVNETGTPAHTTGISRSFGANEDLDFNEFVMWEVGNKGQEVEDDGGEEYSLTTDELINHLKNGIVEVIFTKANGEERKMVCTLDFGIIPEDHIPNSSEQDVNSAVIKVFDLEKDEWRSFRKDSVISVKLGVTH